MKIQTIVIAISLLLLAACAKEAPSTLTTPVAPTEPPVAKAMPVPSPEPVKEMEAQPTAPPAQIIPDALKTQLAKRTTIKSVAYDFKTTKETLQYHFMVRGNKAKVTPAGTQTLTKDGKYFTSIYLDLNAKTAVAWCDDNNLCDSYAEKGPFQVNYDEYYRKTPFDWTLELEQGKYLPLTKDAGDTLVNDRTASSWRHEEGGIVTRYYVDNFYGVVLKVELIEGEGKKTNYIFESTAFNTVTDADVTPS